MLIKRLAGVTVKPAWPNDVVNIKLGGKLVPKDTEVLDRLQELAKDVVNCGQHTANIDIRFLLPGGPVDTLRMENEQLVVIKNCAQTLRDVMKEHLNNPEWWWQAAENLDGALKESEELESV